MHVFVFVILSGVAAFSIGTNAVAGEVNDFLDRDEWENAVGPFTTIDFTQYPSQTIITDQYIDLGVLFEGNNRIWETPSFVNDGQGLAGFGGTWLNFSEPMNWIAVDFPGAVLISLFDGDELIYESFQFGGSGTGFFAGLTSDQPFDRIYLFRQWPDNNNVFIDDLHFGPAIPGPGVLGVFALAAMAGRGRRRRRVAGTEPSRRACYG